jgi:hypothetical protein
MLASALLALREALAYAGYVAVIVLALRIMSSSRLQKQRA